MGEVGGCARALLGRLVAKGVEAFEGRIFVFYGGGRGGVVLWGGLGRKGVHLPIHFGGVALLPFPI